MHLSQVDGTEEAVVNSLTHMIIVAPEDLGPFVICFWSAMVLSTLSLRPEPRKKLMILDSSRGLIFKRLTRQPAFFIMETHHMLL